MGVKKVMLSKEIVINKKLIKLKRRIRLKRIENGIETIMISLGIVNKNEENENNLSIYDDSARCLRRIGSECMKKLSLYSKKDIEEAIIYYGLGTFSLLYSIKLIFF